MYPVSISLDGRRVLIVGGGAVGERRALGVLGSGAAVTVVAPDATAKLTALGGEGALTLLSRAFDAADLDGITLVFACTPTRELNDVVLAAARSAGVLCNDAVDGELGDFVVPAVARVGPLTFAIESGGASPSFAKRLRDELTGLFDERYGKAAETLARVRDIVKATVPMEHRSAVMERIAARPLDVLVGMHLGDQENAVEDAFHAELAAQDRLIAFTPQSRVCATRRSALALVQTRAVTARLARAHVASTLLEISSTGDRIQDRPLTQVGVGVFTSELEDALHDGRADYAVHSCKDLPGRLADGLVIAAITKRADPRDMFCSVRYARFSDLPPGARVGTSSPRRRAQLCAIRGDLQYLDIRGNIDTRLRKLGDGEFDAIILAAAGLERLGLKAPRMHPFEVDEMVPAVGQGALAIEARSDDDAWLATLHDALTDFETEIAVRAERAFLAEVRGGCHAPIGAYAVLDMHGSLHMRAVIASPDGSSILRDERLVDMPVDIDQARRAADEIGRSVARSLLDRGGAELLAAIFAQREGAGEAAQPSPIVTFDDAAPLRGLRILMGRTQDRPSRIAAALREAGADVVEVTEDDTVDGDTALDAILFPSSGSVAIVAGHTSALFHTEADTLVVAMGSASAEAAREAGFAPHVVAPRPDIPTFVHTVMTALLERHV